MIEIGWARWYGEARAEMAFTYGRRRIPADTYKEQWAQGRTPSEGCATINREMRGNEMGEAGK